jgi:hypothetical protein
MDYINDLHELCETISREIGDANEKIRNAGGKLTAGDADYIDKLTHSLKSIKATIAMMEDEDGYSSANYPMGGSYARRGGYSRENGTYRSYARGRMNAPRDSMGRYSGRYSRDDGMVEELRGLMEDAPNDAIKRDIQRLVDKLEQM